MTSAEIWIKPVTLEGRFIRLEPLEPRHYAGLFGTLEPQELRFIAPPTYWAADSLGEFIGSVAWPASRIPFAVVSRKTGEVVGCIDLQKIKLNDIIRKKTDSILYVRLPAPELCYVKINHAESRVYNTENTFFSGGEIVEKAYKETEKQIEKAALSSNILEQTKQNATVILKPFLEKIAGKKVVFI